MKKSRIKKRSQKIGLPPGELVYVGESNVKKSDVTVFSYSESVVTEKTVTIKEIKEHQKEGEHLWIDLNGVSDVAAVKELGELFGLHPLVLEDIVNTGQRPKIEYYDGYIFVVAKMLHYDDTLRHINAEQVSFVLKNDCLITFQEEHYGDVFNAVRDRLRNKRGLVRGRGVDYLLYALLDSIVDQYFIITEKLGGRVEDTEEEVTVNHSSEMIQSIHLIKSELIQFRRVLYPMMELLRDLLKDETDIIHRSNHKYFQDIYDHAKEIVDIVETSREVTTHVLSIYMSQVSNKMNETMKLLTVIATIFIPLTFVVGVYGMNFEFMPELHWKYGYAAVWALMFLITAGIFAVFRKRKMM